MEDFGPFYYLCNYLGVYLGSHYSTLDRNLQETLLTIIQTSNKEFSKRLIWTLLVRFSTMDKKFQEKILEIIGQRMYVIADFESEKELASWFVHLISIFTDLDKEIQEKVLELGVKRKELTPTLLLLDLPSLIEVQEQVLRIAEDEKGLSIIIISKFAEKFTSMNKEFRQKLLESASRSMSVGALLGISLRSKMNSFDKELKEEIEKAARKNVYFASTLASKEITDDEIRQQLMEMTDDQRQEHKKKAKEIAEKYTQQQEQKRRTVKEIVVEACQSWPYYNPEGRDLNPVDILHIADTFRKFRRLGLGLVTTSIVEALLIIDSVEAVLQTQISHGIRNASPDNLANSLTLLENTELGTIEEAIMKSLYVWFGCIQIDKACRLSDALGSAFDKDYAMRIHSELVERPSSTILLRLLRGSRYNRILV